MTQTETPAADATPQPFFGGVTFQNVFTYRSTWLTLLLMVIPVLIPVVLPLVEQWLGIDLPDDAIIAIVNKLIEILVPSGLAAAAIGYGAWTYKTASIRRSAAMERQAEAAARSGTNRTAA